MANESRPKIENLLVQELLAYMEAVNIVCDFYDNEAKANTGMYDGTEEALYNAATSEFNKYLALKERIFNEIKKRIDALC